MKDVETSAASGGRLPLVVGGLLGVGVAIATLTFLFWRHTRPEYDDYFAYDGELDELAASSDGGAVVTAGATVAAATVSAAGSSTLERSAYPPDEQATVVVKPLSELQSSKAASAAAPGSSDLNVTEQAGGTGPDGGSADVEGSAATAGHDVDGSDGVAGAGIASSGTSPAPGELTALGALAAAAKSDQAAGSKVQDTAGGQSGAPTEDAGGETPEETGVEVSRFVARSGPERTIVIEDDDLFPQDDADRDTPRVAPPSVVAFADPSSVRERSGAGDRDVLSESEYLDEDEVDLLSTDEHTRIAAHSGEDADEDSTDGMDDWDPADHEDVQADVHADRPGVEPLRQPGSFDEGLDDGEHLHVSEHEPGYEDDEVIDREFVDEEILDELPDEGLPHELDNEELHDLEIHDEELHDEEFDHEELHDEEFDHEEFDDEEFDDEPSGGLDGIEEQPQASVSAPSAVTILGPMRPTVREVDGDPVEADSSLLDPELEIVTLEDIERARAGTRSGDRHG